MFADFSGMDYYAISTVIVLLSLVPFFASFEGRRPQAREVVLLAVLCAIAVASRAAFMFAPSFKPMVGIVMIAGIALGPQTGFLTGAISALVSNFLFGHGPWTPWQMLAYGSAGLVFGCLARGDLIPRSGWSAGQKLAIAALGFAFVVCVVGPILDTCSLFTMTSHVSMSMAIAVYSAGLPFNLIHGLAVAMTLFFVGASLLQRLDRVRVKYGLMEARG